MSRGRRPGLAGLRRVGSPRSYHRIVTNESGGKDSQTAKRAVWQWADAEGATDRLVGSYARVGERIVWPGTRELSQELGEDLVSLYGDRPSTEGLVHEHADHYGTRLEVAARPGGDLLDEIERRGKFPDAARRWCTSDLKRGPGLTVLTRLVRELNLPGPARVLYVFGFRTEEPGRKDKPPFEFNARASNSRRHVYNWYPILDWTLAQVWDDIDASGVPYAWPYDAGMSRLSCALCVLACKGDLLTAARLRPDLVAQYLAVERRIGHRFRAGYSMADLAREAGVAA